MSERPDNISLQHRSAILNEKTITVEISLLKPIQSDGVECNLIKYKVKQPSLGVLEEVGSIVDAIPSLTTDETDTSTLFERLQSDASAQRKVLACLLEGKAYPSDFTVDIVTNNISHTETLPLLIHLFSFADLKSFSTTTILMKGIGLQKSREIIARPQNEKGSAEVKTFGEPLIAPVAGMDGAFIM